MKSKRHNVYCIGLESKNSGRRRQRIGRKQRGRDRRREKQGEAQTI